MTKLFNASLTAHMRKYRKDDQMKLLNDELHNELLKEELEKDENLRNIAARSLRIKELREKIKSEKLPGKAALAGERTPDDIAIEKAIKTANEAKIGRMVELLSKSKKADAIGRLIRHSHEKRGSATLQDINDSPETRAARDRARSGAERINEHLNYRTERDERLATNKKLTPSQVAFKHRGMKPLTRIPIRVRKPNDSLVRHKGRYASVLPGIKLGRSYSTVANYRSSIPEGSPPSNELVHVPIQSKSNKRASRSRSSSSDTSVESENTLFTHGGYRPGSGRKHGSKTGARRARKLGQSIRGIQM